MGQGQGGAAPVMRFKCWPLEIAIWSSQKTNDNGQQYTEYSYKLRKTWKSATSPTGYEQREIGLFGDDLLKAATLLAKAHDFAEVAADVPDGRRGVQRGRK